MAGTRGYLGRHPGLLVGVVVGVTSSLLVARDVSKPIFRDEGSSLYSAHLPWSELWQQSRLVDAVMLPYYALLHLWVQVSSSIEWARSLSLLAYGLTVLLVAVLAGRLTGVAGAVVASLVVATNPLMVGAALSARPTALSALVATCAVAALLRWRGDTRARWLWAFAVLTILTALFHLFAVLAPLCALGGSILAWRVNWRERWRSAVAPLAAMGLVGASLLVAASGQVGQVSWIKRETPVSALTHVLGPVSGGPPAYGLCLVVIALLAGGLLASGRWSASVPDTRRLNTGSWVVVTSWAFGPALILVLASLWSPLYLQRYVTASAPGLALSLAMLVGAGLGRLTARAGTRAGVVAGTLVALSIIIVALPGAASMAARSPEDTRGIAAFLVQHAGADSWVALPNHADAAAITPYWDEARRRPQLWPQCHQLLIEGIALDASGQAIRRAPASIWLVDDGSAAGIDAFLARLTAAGYHQADLTTFGNVEVLHLVRAHSVGAS